MQESALRPFLIALDQGDDGLFDEAFVRYGQRLVAIARQRLGTRLQAKFDPDDVVQSVFRSFCQRARDGQFEFDDWNDLWALLVTITIRKCINRQTHFLAGRRDVRREQAVSLTDATFSQVTAREPTPLAATLFVEALQQLLDSLEPSLRDVARLYLQGYTVREISKHTGRSERTTRRLVARVRASWAQTNEREARAGDPCASSAPS